MRKFGLRHQCAFGALAISLAIAPAAAQAQDATTADAEEAQPADNTGLDTGNVIIVRAQGREQALADVPVAVSAVSGEMLEKSGVADIRDLTQVAPSLLVSSSGNEANGSARIRGIGTVGDNPGLESSVAVFVDGVYRSRSGNALSELGPLDRVEILRGPQGTLGGRNSSAGLINIYTAPPEFEFSGYGAFTYGNYDAIKVEGGVNAPLGDTVAARVDGVYFKRDGFYNDVVNNVKSTSVTAISFARSCCSNRPATSASASSGTIRRRTKPAAPPPSSSPTSRRWPVYRPASIRSPAPMAAPR